MKSLSYKIGLGYFVLICINIAITVFAIYHIRQLGSPVDRILKEKYQNVNAAESMALALRQQVLAQQALLKTPTDSSLINNFNTYKNEFYNWHQKAIEGIALPDEPVILEKIRETYQQYLAISDRLEKLLQKQKPTAANRFFETNVKPRVAIVENFCADLKRANEQAIAAADAKAQKVSGQAMLVIIGIAGLAIFLSVGASVWFTRSIIKPVKETTETVRRISQGKLNQKIAISTDDEIAELGREFNKMTERLQEYEQMNIRQILQEKKKSETIVAGIPAAIIVTDNRQRITLMNDRARQLLNIAGENWRGHLVDDIIHDEGIRKILLRENNETASPGEIYKSLVALQNGPEEFFFAVRQIKISDPESNALGWVTLLQDVTRFKNLDRLKSEFMATISHEFKTPLTSINMTIDILLRQARGALNEQQRELLDDAKADCLRLRTLVTDLLDLSRLESGNYRLDFKRIDVPQLIDDALQPLRFAIEKRQIQLAVDCESPLPEFEADFHQLSRVLTNLIENGIQHTPESGDVRIAIQHSQQAIRFCVADSGEGIPEDALDLIFDKFVQVKNFQNADAGNKGLGLAISREIVNAHHGQIWAESKLGEGSRFFFTIPVKKADREDIIADNQQRTTDNAR